ncbi:MAG TPA: polyprenol monophosphomannose synthase [Candidatus Desulfaltia sp.]|nr:polyprenol monophosphomannose synthase [Candidatus Desulfaltia sp.]
MAESRSRLVIMIPTYNERENIGGLIQEILALPTGYDLAVLVVDDDSPDGTAGAVAEISRRDPRVHILVRREARGRGLAGIEGFRRSLDLGADFIIEMDGDGSHQPASIPSLLEGARRADLVLGSRFVAGGRDADRSPCRRLITFLVRRFIRRLFRISVNDVSSGFRCFRREVLERIGLDSLVSTGPSVVLEVLYKADRLGFTIGEVPIVFIDRKKGRTKLTGLTLWKTLLLALRIKKMYKHLEPLGET